LTRIGLISDTHGYLDEAVFEHFKNCDEIWHAGDFGASPQPSPLRVEGVSEELSENKSENKNAILNKSYGDIFTEKFLQLNKKKIIFRGVYGNIDDAEIRNIYPEKLFFTVENINVFIIHIGGYPGRYSKGVKEEIILNKSQLFISGHSHILKIMYDDKLKCLHMNAGAAGKQGWHKVRTLIRFTIDGKDMKDCEVIELS
jgi:uncharacterized protein